MNDIIAHLATRSGRSTHEVAVVFLGGFAQEDTMLKKYLLMILVAMASSIYGMQKKPAKEEIAQQEKQAYENLLALVKDRIDRKLDLNQPIVFNYLRYTPLIKACRNGDQYLFITQLLLNNGADPDVRDDNGQTPLHHAADQFAIETTKALLAAKPKPANPNSISDVFGSPLHNVCSDARDEIYDTERTSKRVKIAKLLLQSSHVDPNNAQNSLKYTCLHYLITRSYHNFSAIDALMDSTKEQRKRFFNQRKKLIKSILKYGGSLEIANARGNTPIQQAYENYEADPLNKRTYRKLAKYALRKRLFLSLGHASKHDTKEKLYFQLLPKEIVNLIIKKMYPSCPEQIIKDLKKYEIVNAK